MVVIEAMSQTQHRTREQGQSKPSAAAEALRVRADHDGTSSREMWPVEVKRTTAEELPRLGDGNGEVADVLADLGEGPAQQGSIGREAVDQTMNLLRIL